MPKRHGHIPMGSCGQKIFCRLKLTIYESCSLRTIPTWDGTFQNLAFDNMPDLARKPIIFVGHSLGGLVIKQALILAKQNDRVYGSIRETTRALVFFGTPHRGGNGTTLGKTAASVVKFFTGNRSNDLVDALKASSKHLAYLTADFAHQYEDYEFLSVVETKGILRVPLRTVIVDLSSSVIGLAGHRERVVELDRDHRQICKFANLEDCKRVITHLKRLADTAMNMHVDVDTDSKDRPEGYESRVTTHQKIPSKKSILFNTINFWQKEQTIGRSQVIEQLERFFQEDHLPGILLHGPAGSGKSQVAFEFATHKQHSCSVFWLSGHNCDAIQDWVNRASYAIKPEFYNVYLANHQIFLRNWLMNEENGNWILIVDDLCVETELQNLVPSPVAWGKVIITSRRDNLLLSFPVMKLHMPPLSPEDGLSLFWSRSRSTTNSMISELSKTSSLLPLIKELCDEPAAIVFAASCVSSSDPTSAAKNLSMLEEENSLSSPSRDSKTLKWASITIDDLSLMEMFILSEIFLFDSRKISENTLEVILAPSRSGSDLFDIQFIQRQVVRRALQQLVSRQLLRREHDPWSAYYSMPTVIQEVLHHKLTSNQEQFRVIAKIAKTLICTAYDERDFNTVSDFESFMSIISPHYRAMSLMSLGRLERSEIGVYCLSEAMFLHYLMKAIEEGVRRSIKQSFRTWMVQNRHEPSQSPMVNTEDEQSGHLDINAIPLWLSLKTSEETHSDDNLKKSPIWGSIKNALWTSIRDSITIGMVGRAWHGIREDIFDFIRQNRNSRSDTEVAAIINEVDKGGCEGLIHAVKTYVHGDTFKKEMMDRAGTDVIDDIAQLVDYAIDDKLAGLEDFATADVVHNALEFLMTSTFHETSNSFEAMLAPLKTYLYTMLRSPLDVGSPDSFKGIISFTVTHMSENYIRSYALSVGHAFWEVLSAAQIWIAAAIVSRVSFTLLAFSTPATPFESVSLFLDEQDPRRKYLAALNTRCMELAREGIMALHNRLTSAWRLSLRKATYWCLLAEETRRGWAEDHTTGCVYIN